MTHPNRARRRKRYTVKMAPANTHRIADKVELSMLFSFLLTLGQQTSRCDPDRILYSPYDPN